MSLPFGNGKRKQELLSGYCCSCVSIPYGNGKLSMDKSFRKVGTCVSIPYGNGKPKTTLKRQRKYKLKCQSPMGTVNKEVKVLIVVVLVAVCQSPMGTVNDRDLKEVI